MAGETDQHAESGVTPVPDLIERYRVRRDVWIAQADELARLKNEVRASAEREAMDIVAAARRDVRKVIADARSELLALSAQVQAALGEPAPGTDPAALLDKAGITAEAGHKRPPARSFVAEEELDEILDEVHEDMAGLAGEAKGPPAHSAAANWLRTPAGLSIAAGVLVAFVSIWWLLNGDSRPSEQRESAAASPVPSSVAPATRTPQPALSDAAPPKASKVPSPAPTLSSKTSAPAPPDGGRPSPPVASAAPEAAPSAPASPASSAAASPASSATASPSVPAPADTPPEVAPSGSPNQIAAAESPRLPSDGVADPSEAVADPTKAAAVSADLPSAANASTVVVANARRWLDAYHRQDQTTMASLSTDNPQLADERRPDERFPAGLADVTRTLDRISVQVAADTAVLTAVMMERSASAQAPHVSPISQVWVMGGGQWKMQQARFVSEARLNQVFK